MSRPKVEEEPRLPEGFLGSLIEVDVRGMDIVCARCWRPVELHGSRCSLRGRLRQRAAQARYRLVELLKRLRRLDPPGLGGPMFKL